MFLIKHSNSAFTLPAIDSVHLPPRLSFEEAAKGGKKTINLGRYGGDLEVNIPAGECQRH